MRLTCRRDDLSRALAVPANIAPQRTPKPSLLAVKLQASGQEIVIEASDDEVWARSRVSGATVERPGEVALPAATIDSIVKSIESSTLSIEVQGRFCEVRAPDALYNLVTGDGADFPYAGRAVPALFEIPRKDFEELVQRTTFAVGRDVGRYAVQGLMLEYEDQVLTVVATDGRRLARATRRVKASGEDGNRREAIVPPKALVETLRGTTDAETITVGIDDEFASFTGATLTITARQVTGDFPDHRKIVPHDHVGRFKVSRDALLAAIRKTAIFSPETLNFIHFDVTEGALTLSAEAEGRGRANTKLSCEMQGASQLSVDLNPDYLLDYLKAVPPGTLTVEFRDPQGALLFRHGESHDVYLVMPITTN